MTMSNERPLGAVAKPARLSGDYSLHPLTALDGVLICGLMNGETIGYFFGPNEEAAAEAVAVALRQRVEAGAERSAR
jgi:hypothetical protein